jgi:hypothetical protein
MTADSKYFFPLGDISFQRFRPVTLVSWTGGVGTTSEEVDSEHGVQSPAAISRRAIMPKVQGGEMKALGGVRCEQFQARFSFGTVPNAIRLLTHPH